MISKCGWQEGSGSLGRECKSFVDFVRVWEGGATTLSVFVLERSRQSDHLHPVSPTRLPYLLLPLLGLTPLV